MLIHYTPDYKNQFGKIISDIETSYYKRYIFLETCIRYGEFDINQCDRVTIVNVTKQILPSPVIKKKEENCSRVAIYFGKYTPRIPGKISKEDLITINESHFTVSYSDKVIDDNKIIERPTTTLSDKGLAIETYSSYDSYPFSEPKRRIQDKIVILDDPYPEFFTMKDQMLNLKHNKSFGNNLINSDLGLYQLELKDLLDDKFTEIQKINFANVLDKKENMIERADIYSSYRGDNVSELYSIIAMVKYSLEVNGIRKAIVIFDIERGFNIVPDSIDMMIPANQLQMNLSFSSAALAISDLFENQFKSYFYYEQFVLYMYFAPYTNKIDIIYPYINDNTNKDKIDVPPDEISGEILSALEGGGVG